MKGINIKIFKIKELFMKKLTNDQVSYMSKRIFKLSIFNSKFKVKSIEEEESLKQI